MTPGSVPHCRRACSPPWRPAGCLWANWKRPVPLAVRSVAVAGRPARHAVHGARACDAGDHQGPAWPASRRPGRSAGRIYPRAPDRQSAEDTVRAAANHVYILYRAGRFTEALDVAPVRAGMRWQALDAPPSMTSGSAPTRRLPWSPVASGEAASCSTELITESAINFTRYLQLLQLELAVGRGDASRPTLAETLRKSPEDPRLLGALHGCLAEQALNAGDLTLAATEVLDGIAALTGAAIAEEEIRLLAVGARLAADLALLPDPLRRWMSPTSGHRWPLPSPSECRSSSPSAARANQTSLLCRIGTSGTRTPVWPGQPGDLARGGRGLAASRMAVSRGIRAVARSRSGQQGGAAGPGRPCAGCLRRPGSPASGRPATRPGPRPLPAGPAFRPDGQVQ